MSTDTPVAATRMRGEDRRELVLDAAMGVFGDYGYYGATTEQVARAAGVSQPYVIRMFGTKENLFLAVLDRALDKLFASFEVALAKDEPKEMQARIGSNYVELLRDRGLLLTLMHAFVLGSDPVIGARARAGFLRVYEFFRDRAGMNDDQARETLAQGMLINTLVGLRMADDYDTDPKVAELMQCVFPTKLTLMLELAPKQLDASRTAGP